MESRVGPDMTEVRVLVQFRTFRVQTWVFNEIMCFTNQIDDFLIVI